MENQPINVEKLTIALANINPCSSYDEECVDVANPIKCFLGGPGRSWYTIEDGRLTKITMVSDRADGYCPLIHQCN